MNSPHSEVAAAEPSVVLVNPPLPPFWYKTESLGMAYLAAYLRASGIGVKLVDADLEGLEVEQITRSIMGHPSVAIVGFTVSSPGALPSAIEIASVLKVYRPQIHVSLGGHYPTFWFKEILERHHTLVDSVVLSEGEVSFLELVQSVSNMRDWRQVEGLACYYGGKVVVNGGRAYIEDLDTLPFPARDLAPAVIGQGFPVVISSSRGCPYNCSFCQIHGFYRVHSGSRYRVRSAQNTVDELEMLVREYGARTFFFVDDSLAVGEAGKQRGIEIGRQILRRGLKVDLIAQCLPSDVDQELFALLREAGLYLVYLGFESPVARSLQLFRKPFTVEQSRTAVEILSGLDIQVSPGVIIHDTETTLGELRETVRVLAQIPAMAPFDIHGLSILKGTELETKLAAQGRLIRQEWHLEYFVSDPGVELVRRLLANYRELPAYRDLLSVLYGKMLLLNRGCCAKKDTIREGLAAAKVANLRFLDGVITCIERNSLRSLTPVFAESTACLEAIAATLKSL